MGRTIGITEEKLRRLSDFERDEVFSERERLVLRYAIAMTDTPVRVSDALFGSLRAEFGPAELVELTSALAWENFRARFDHAFGLGAQGFSEGMFCPVPDGT